MILFWLLWMSLVLGGVVAGLWNSGALRDLWLRIARVPVRVRRPVYPGVRDDRDASRSRGGAGLPPGMIGPDPPLPQRWRR